ncbi:synembryn-A-like [Patiria miniata]|uniref:Synembryn n=1 Tax=Patiria miniata TaxID=46514 RepID=A0A913YXS4_PATMI|nr:synembryn-A-like [Patiria miniata]
MEALVTSMIPAFEAGSEADICNKLQEFNKENAQTFSFPELGSETKKKFIGDVLRSLEAKYNTECYCLCLEALRILSREKHHLYQLAQKDGILLLMKLAGLEEKPTKRSDQVIIEAEKCLCNLVYNSSQVQTMCQDSKCVKYLMNRVRLYPSSEPQISTDIKFFDMRLLFLMTALCPKTRSFVRKEYNGIELLTQVLETEVLGFPPQSTAPPATLSQSPTEDTIGITDSASKSTAGEAAVGGGETVTDTVTEPATEPVTDAVPNTTTDVVSEPAKETVADAATDTVVDTVTNSVVDSVTDAVVDTATHTVTDRVGDTVVESVKMTAVQADLACEVFKALFNTVIHTKAKELEKELEPDVLRRLGIACRCMLLSDSTTPAKTEECHSQTINLMTCALPLTCIQELTPEPSGGAAGGDLLYDGHSMDAIVSILKFLEMRVDRAAAAKKLHVVEQLNPVLSALCVLSRTDRRIRRYLKETVLPPLNKDQACHLPEEGISLRNKLVRLMTNHSTDIKEVVADLLFILCKESVNRLIKYTGYGNAAGMLARRGLLAGGHGNRDYSSDEDDSDTEEYKDVRNEVNPVTGRVESERPNPMEGMTDEQKEVAAIELANMIHRITREGVIQPMSVSDDGKLVPMMDIVQKAAMEASQTQPSDDDEDDDDTNDNNN